jgi:hypothetical protein
MVEASIHFNPPTPRHPIEPLPTHHNTPKHRLKSHLPRFMLKIMHPDQCPRPPSGQRQSMQCRFFDPPLQIPRLHLIVTVKQKRNTANRGGVEYGPRCVRRGVKAYECARWQDEGEDAGDGSEG